MTGIFLIERPIMRNIRHCLLFTVLVSPMALADEVDRKDAAIGGAIGGALGAVVGAEIGDREGAIVGAGVGAAVGTAVATREASKTEDAGYSSQDSVRIVVDTPHRGIGQHCPPGQAKKGRC